MFPAVDLVIFLAQSRAKRGSIARTTPSDGMVLLPRRIDGGDNESTGVFSGERKFDLPERELVASAC